MIRKTPLTRSTKPIPKRRATKRRRLAGCPVLRCKRSPYRRDNADNLCVVHLKQRLDKLARAKCLDNFGPACQAGGYIGNAVEGGPCSSDNLTPSVQWAHIVRRGRGHTRWLEGNALPLCAAHHTFFTRRPESWTVFVDDMIGVEKHRDLMRESLKDEKVDLVEWWKRLSA